jgi:hypothetical protein
VYDHAIATIALCEAALDGEPEVVKSAALAVNLVHRARNPHGAWRYDDPPIGENDTSVTGWMVLALASAEAAGFSVEEAAFESTARWIDEMTEPRDGRVGYDRRGSRSSRVMGINDVFPPERGEAMTAVGLFIRQLLGQRPDGRPIVQAHVDLLLGCPPRWNPEERGCDFYYWYWGALAMHQVGGEAGAQWRAALIEALLSSQKLEGHGRGSWDPAGPWGWSGGRVYSTAMAALCLEAPRRYGRFVE